MSHNKKGKQLKPKKQHITQPAQESQESHENFETGIKPSHVDRSGFLHK